jgi:hypothetical protein
MRRLQPDWTIPADLNAIVAREGEWDSDHWQPISLSVLGDTTYGGRNIPLSWQIAFAPSGADFVEANQRISIDRKNPDAYDWSRLIIKAFAARYPQFATPMMTVRKLPA